MCRFHVRHLDMQKQEFVLKAGRAQTNELVKQLLHKKLKPQMTLAKGNLAVEGSPYAFIRNLAPSIAFSFFDMYRISSHVSSFISHSLCNCCLHFFFYFYPLVGNKHRDPQQTLWGEWETLKHSAPNGMSLLDPSLPGLRETLGRGGGKSVRGRGVEEYQENRFSKHSRISAHMNWQRLCQNVQNLLGSKSDGVPALRKEMDTNLHQ